MNKKTIDFSDLPLHDAIALVMNTALVAKRSHPDNFKIICDNDKIGIVMTGFTYDGENVVKAKPLAISGKVVATLD